MTSLSTGTEPLLAEETLAASKVTVPAGWHAYLLPIRHFPMPARDRLPVAERLWGIVDRLLPHRAANDLCTWLLTDNLFKEDAIREVSRRTRDWMPSFGMGLWPDRDPPKMIDRQEILDMEFGQKVRRPYHQVIRIRAEDERLQRDCYTTMFGFGSTVLTCGTGGGGRLLADARDALSRPITDESFRNFPFYFPLLGAATVAAAYPTQMSAWLGGTDLYLRESEEDHAVLALSRLPLEAALEQGGFRLPPGHGDTGR